MALQLRIYKTKPGRLDDWVGLFERSVRDLRAAQGFSIQAWKATGDDRFIWLVEYPGTEAEFEAADRAYYELPDHKPLHEEALNYLDSSESWFVDPVGAAD
jgi:hypothetical protein